MFVAEAYAQTTPAPAAPEPAAPPAATDGNATPVQAGTEQPHDDAHGGGGAFPPFDASTFPSQLLWLAITFGLFYVFLKRVVIPRIGGILEIRSDRITQDLDQAARMKDEADAAIAAYEQELASAKTKANEIGQQARDKAKAEAEAERKAAESELDKKLGASTARIESIKSAAMADVGAIATETATAILDRLIGAKASKGEVEAAVSQARR